MSTRGKQAAILLRVSSRGQVETDYDPEGLSLPAQRQACEGKAAAVDAEPVLEYIEPGVSGGLLVKRKVFQKMLSDIRERGDIDYVIVWSVSRWARNQEDHWTARGLINRAGAKLISVKEPIGEDTSHGVMLEGVMAAMAASRRIEISEEVSRGVQRKVEVGGFPGYAPLGYRNIREPLPQGGEVRTIAIDSERVEIVRWGFETYATGLYSINDMVTLLGARGLRSRGNRRYGARRLRPSAVQALLNNPFYCGKFFYKGKLYKGRHEAIISEELFDRVQDILKAHNLSGERDRKHQHYLKGTIFCDECKHRLIYSRHKGNGGVYEYFVCPYNQRGECANGYHRAEEVEAKIENHYKTITLTQEERDRVVGEVERRLAKLATVSEQEQRRCNALLADLKEQEHKLMDKHYKDELSEEFFSEEAARIKKERVDAKAILARLTIRHEELGRFLAMVLRVVSYDLHDLYLRAAPHIRRLMNQAIFEAIWIADDEEIRSDLASPVKEAHAIKDDVYDETKRSIRSIQSKARKRRDSDGLVPVGVGAAENEEAPNPGEAGSGDFARGSISASMVGTGGFEPPTSRV
jgi:site-specific DNA recombinase